MPTIPNTAVARTDLAELALLLRGKVRDVYDAGPEHLLMVTTDRLSAYDVILPDPVPGKGAILTAITDFWLDATAHICPNQATTLAAAALLTDPADQRELGSRARVVKRTRALPVEAVVRGYLIGSGWADYQRSGAVCGISLPPGLRQAEQLDTPIFTPARKAEAGDHDENVSFDAVVAMIGAPLATEMRRVALALYTFAVAHAAERGIIIADTKFEFGLDENDQLTLIDEVLTPDSSRFWPADAYQLDCSPPSYDKQFVRDYLTELNWNRQPPAPTLPTAVIDATRQRYLDALNALTS